MAILKAADIVVGGRYRGLHPIKVNQYHRTMWDDREVVWVGPSTVEYQYPAQSLARNTVSMDNFLKWAGRMLGPEEGSDVK